MASLAVPALDTERLTLRGHRREDLGDCAAMWGDAAVTRFIGGRPATEHESWLKVLRYVGHWALMGFGYWVVCEKASGRFVGEVGFADFKRDIDPPLGGAPEIGWVLAPWAHGKGYATEAVRAAVAWGDARFDGARTVCLISPENAASVRVAQKCGYREYARASFHGAATILLERAAGPRAR